MMRVLALAKKEVKKHVAVVHTRGKLTLLQKKVSNILLLNAYSDIPNKSRYQIRVRDLAEYAGFDSKDGALLKRSILSLMTIVIQWNALHDDENDWEASPFLAYASVKKGVCTYGYSPELREKLYDPAIYARINLSVQREFRSGYALSLYENCVRFRRTGSTGWIELDTWRDLLGVTEGTYPAFKELRRRVLNPAVKEVNEHSDIYITLDQPKREKRRIIALKFNIKENSQLSLGLENHPGFTRYEIVEEKKEEEKSSLANRLAEFGLEAQAEDLIGKYDEDRINANLDIVQAKIVAGEKIKKSVPALARDALEKDYRPKKTKIELEVVGKQAETRRQSEAALEAQRVVEEQRRSEQQADNRELDTQIEALSTERRAELEERAERRYMQVLGIGAFDSYQKGKETGSLPRVKHAMMQGYRRDVIESPEFAAPAKTIES